MEKLSLTNPLDIADELRLLCEQPKLCKKQSKMGLSLNDRVVVLQQDSFEYYNISPQFAENDMSTLHQKYFKAAVPLVYIQEVNFLPSSESFKNVLEIVFLGHGKTQKWTERITSDEGIVVKEEKIEKWIFVFTYDLKKFISACQEEKRLAKRNYSRIEPIQSHRSPSVSNRSEASPGRRARENRQIENYVTSIQKTKSHLKQMADQAAQQAKRLLQKKLKQQISSSSVRHPNEQSFKLVNFWREYNRAYDISMRGKGTGMDNIPNELELLAKVESFNSDLIPIVKKYVDEQLLGHDPETNLFNDFFFYDGVWLRTGAKELNHLYLINYYLNDIMYSMGEVKGFKFKLPLMSIVDYKGMKVLCMCNMPFSQIDKTQVYNLFNESCDLQLLAKMKEVFEIYEDILNLKTEPQEIKNKKVLAPLGANLKVYEYSTKKDAAQDNTVSNFYYLISVGKLLPLDFNVQKEKSNLDARVRPELAAMFRDICREENTQLLSQGFLRSALAFEIKKNEDLKIVQAGLLLTNTIIPQFCKNVNSIKILLVDSPSLKQVLEEFGINVRYLYLIYQLVELPYAREIILVEVLARTIKKELKSAIKVLYADSLPQKKYHLSKFQTLKDKREFLADIKPEENKKYCLFILDFLNLVFGVGDETDKFWEIVIEKCQKYYKIKAAYPLQLKPGCLLNAVLWHCKINIPFSAKTPLFKAKFPFTQGDSIVHEARCRSFDFPSMQIQTIYKRVPQLQDESELELFKEASLKILRLELLFNKSLHSMNYRTQFTISKISNLRETMEKPKGLSSLHPSLLPYYLSNKSPYNFQKGLELLDFSLPETHPLFITFYIEYSEIMEPDLLKKTALMLSVKSLGEFHVKTTELYSRFYNQGNLEYKLKAKRVRTIAGCDTYCREMYNDKMYQTCLAFTLGCIEEFNSQNAYDKVSIGNFDKYLSILNYGLESALEISQLDQGLTISCEASSILTSFQTKDKNYDENLIRNTLKIYLLLCEKKYFLYKMVMLAIQVRKNVQPVDMDKEGLALPEQPLKRGKILVGISLMFYEYKNHAGWISYVLKNILRTFKYFNFLEDLFNNYKHHFARYNDINFKTCLGYLDILIRLFGEKFFRQNLYEIGKQ